jgi:hypothetical protein
VGFVVDKVALVQVLSEYFGFPCKFSFHRLHYKHHLSPGAFTTGKKKKKIAAAPSGLRIHETKKKNEVPSADPSIYERNVYN